MLQKGRFLLTSVVTLSAAIMLSTCAVTLSAPQTSASAGGTMSRSGFTSGDLSLGGRRYIGLERPDWLFERMREIRTRGSGPIPDINLTPTATASHELDANAAPYGELNRIVISSDGVDETGDGTFDPDVRADDFNLWLLRLDGTRATQLTFMDGDARYPAYDPGGRVVAFSSNQTGVWQIYTIEVLTGTVRQITSGAGNKYEPTWSPDGNWIAFSGDRAGTRDLYIVPSDGRLPPEQITQSPDDDTQPTWAPSAAIPLPIMFTRSGAGVGSRIYRTNRMGEDFEQVTDGAGDPATNDTDPAWRHDSQLIAFASDRPTDPLDTSRDFNIWTVSPAGEETMEAQLRTNLDPAATTDDRYPAFNPGLDPRQPIRIFFSSWREGNQPDIWRLEVDDPVPPELLDLPTVHARTGAADEEWPWTEAPRRFIQPGAEVMISVPVFDRDSGVAQVMAEIKDPDSKLFAPIGTTFYTNEDGTAMREIDAERVAIFELFDDGDPEHGDRDAGDGVFSGIWQTPTTPRDYIISIYVQDVAGNTMVYDDIYGFTTQVFEPRTNVLFLNDYCEGQRFISALAPAARHEYHSQYPVESYWTTNPGGADVTGNVAFDTFRDLGRYRDGIYLGEDYDVWRVISRGPITMTDLVYYLPTTETQLSVPDLTDTREVLIADRAIVWAAPRTGSLWMGAGALVDATTQATLSTFLDRGGRLFISGQDIGWALTLNGTQSNVFYNNYLRASFVRERARGSTVNNTRPLISGNDDPIVNHPFTVYWDEPDSLTLGQRTIGNVHYNQDCAHNIRWEDVVEPLSGAVATHEYDDDGVAGLRYQDPTGYRVVYFAWGFEQTHRHYRSVGTNWGGQDGAGLCGNYRAKTMHNILCWLRTGGFQGRVLSISDGMRPITDPTPIVRVYRAGQMVAAVQCEEDGRFVVGGLAPGHYTFAAHRPGFEIDHPDGRHVHGGLDYPVIDFAITRAEPGAIRGRVVSEATGEPLATVEVCAYEIIPPEEPEDPEDLEDENDLELAQVPGNDDLMPERGPRIKCTTTDVDGTYVLSGIDVGEVIVEADGANIGYGTAETVVTVVSGDTVTADLALPAAPVELIVTVTDTVGEPLPNGTVEVFSDELRVDEGVTDEDGRAAFELPPGTYTVRATAPGYERSEPVTVTLSADAEPKSESITIALESQPPGSVAGLITRGVTGQPEGGIPVELVVGETVVGETTSDDEAASAPDGSRYNYHFDEVPTGEVVIRPRPRDLSVTPQQRTVEVTTGEWTTSVNFTLTAIRRFPAGLQLISLPWEYPIADPADLLGIDPGELRMATWDAGNARYAHYPSAPADRFRLGSGYWVRFDQAQELAREGTEAGDTHEVRLTAGPGGWNLVGAFFREPIDFFSLRVRERDGTEHNMQQAMSAGLVRSPLFAYVLGGYTTSSVLETYVGYWLSVGANVTIIGDRTTDTLAVGEDATRPAVVAPEDGWLMPLVVESGQMRDSSTWLGSAPAATAGFDAGMDMLKPPPVDMGRSVHAAVEGPEGPQSVAVRPMGEDTEWTLEVRGPEGEKVNVRWPDMTGVPRETRPVLVDPVGGQQVYMRTSQGYEFTAGEGVRRLQIKLLGEDGALAVSTPSAQAAGGGAEISYTLSTDATVDVAVMNIAGRVVGRVVEGALQTAGNQRVTWTGRTTRGTNAPAGMYLVVVRARTQDGQQTEAIGTVALGR